MSEIKDPEKPKSGETKPPEYQNLREHKELLQTRASIAFFAVAILLLVALAVSLAVFSYLNETGKPISVTLWATYALIAVAAIASFAAALTSFDASNPSAPDVIPPYDRDEFFRKIKDRDPESAMSAYFRLRSLRGVSGFFQKMEIVGLPLATIILTILFALMAIAAANGGDDTASVEFLDAMKLTLGALIGSFVQRAVDRKPDARPTSPKPNGQKSR